MTEKIETFLGLLGVRRFITISTSSTKPKHPVTSADFARILNIRKSPRLARQTRTDPGFETRLRSVKREDKILAL